MISAVVASLEFFLASVLIVAGLAKLLDWESFQQSLGEFGLPQLATRSLSRALPALEVVVGAALLVPATAQAAAAAATLLLTTFCIVIATNLARRKAIRCGCFGSVSAQPISIGTLVRTGSLALAAGVAGWLEAVNGPIGGLGWLARFEGTELVAVTVSLVLGLAVVALAWMLVYLLKEYGLLLGIEDEDQPARRGLPLSSPAPDFRLPTPTGEWASLFELRGRGLPVALLFTDPICGHCSPLYPDVGRWQRELAGRFTVVMVSSGTAEETAKLTREHGISPILLQDGRSVSSLYETGGVPSAVIVSPEGAIDSLVALGTDPVRDLMESCARKDASDENVVWSDRNNDAISYAPISG
jgi:peroxiredoxin/uncharacterized membrane protein